MFADIDLLHKVVVPALRMSLKLHQVSILFVFFKHKPETSGGKKMTFQKHGPLAQHNSDKWASDLVTKCVCVCVCVCAQSSPLNSVAPWTVALQALLFMEFSR